MRDRVCPPRRMRFSFESRCRMVAWIVAGGVRQASGGGMWREPGDRLSALGSLSGGRLGGACGSAVDAGGSRGGCRRRRSRRSSSARASSAPALPWSRPIVGRPARRSGRCCAGRAARGCRGRSVTGVSATSATGRASCCTSTPRSWAASQVGKRIRRRRQPRPRAGWQHLHVAIDDHTRLAYCELLPSERKQDCGAFPPARGRLVRRARHHRRAGPHRQREGLPLARLARHLRRARDRAPLHPPLLAPDKRKSRSADQDAAQRMGLPLRLPHQQHTAPSPPRLRTLVQPTTTPQLARRQTTDQPRLTPLWSVQLDGCAGLRAGLLSAIRSRLCDKSAPTAGRPTPRCVHGRLVRDGQGAARCAGPAARASKRSS